MWDSGEIQARYYSNEVSVDCSLELFRSSSSWLGVTVTMSWVHYWMKWNVIMYLSRSLSRDTFYTLSCDGRLMWHDYLWKKDHVSSWRIRLCDKYDLHFCSPPLKYQWFSLALKDMETILEEIRLRHAQVNSLSLSSSIFESHFFFWIFLVIDTRDRKIWNRFTPICPISL